MAGFGLKIVRSTGPDGFVGNSQEYPISPANPDPIFMGDLVALSGGFVIEASGATDNNDFSVLGVFQGCRYVDADGSYKFKPYWDGVAGRSNVIAKVAIPDGATFLIAGDPAGTYTQASVGARFGTKYAAGSALYGDSRITMGAAPAATGPLIVHRLADTPNNAFGNDYPLLEVGIVRRQLHPALV